MSMILMTQKTLIMKKKKDKKNSEEKKIQEVIDCEEYFKQYALKIEI